MAHRPCPGPSPPSTTIRPPREYQKRRGKATSRSSAHPRCSRGSRRDQFPGRYAVDRSGGPNLTVGSTTFEVLFSL